MKTVIFVALLVGATALVAVAPATEAKPYCDWEDWSCPGTVCVGDPVDGGWIRCIPRICPYDGCIP